MIDEPDQDEIARRAKLQAALDAAQPSAFSNPAGVMGKGYTAPEVTAMPPEPPRPNDWQSEPEPAPQQMIASLNIGDGEGVLNEGQQVIAKSMKSAGGTVTITTAVDGKTINFEAAAGAGLPANGGADGEYWLNDTKVLGVETYTWQPTLQVAYLASGILEYYDVAAKDAGPV